MMNVSALDAPLEFESYFWFWFDRSAHRFACFKSLSCHPSGCDPKSLSVQVSFFADILEGGQVLYSLKKDHSADSLSQWPNAKPILGICPRFLGDQ